MDREVIEKLAGQGAAQQGRQNLLQSIAELARKLKGAGLEPDVVMRLLRETFPSLSGAFAGLDKYTAEEYRNKHNELRKALGDTQRFDLDSEVGRNNLVVEVAKKYHPGESDAVAFTKYTEDWPEAVTWIYAAPSVQPAPEPEPEAPVQKSWSQMNVGERASAAWESSVQQIMKQRDLSYEQATAAFFQTAEAGELWEFMTEPRKDLSLSKYVEVTERDEYDGDASLALVAKRILGDR